MTSSRTLDTSATLEARSRDNAQLTLSPLELKCLVQTRSYDYGVATLAKAMLAHVFFSLIVEYGQLQHGPMSVYRGRRR
jgi:hypothetical protein